MGFRKGVSKRGHIFNLRIATGNAKEASASGTLVQSLRIVLMMTARSGDIRVRLNI